MDKQINSYLYNERLLMSFWTASHYYYNIFSLFVYSKVFLFIEQRCNYRVINVGAVIPVETGVDE